MSQPVTSEPDGEKLTRVIRLAIGKDCDPISAGGRVRAYKLLQLFSDEDIARTYLEQHLWNNEPYCPRCHSSTQVKARGKGLFCCNACEYGFTVRAGAIFENSHIPLRKWLCAIFLFSSARERISSVKLAAQLSIRQASAWSMIRRIREVWNQWKDVFRKLLEGIGACLDSTHSWPFFSAKTPRLTRIVEVAKDDPYYLPPDQLLVTSLTLEAGKLVKPWTAFYEKRPLTKSALLALERRNECSAAHSEDHLRRIPRPAPMKDCPICRFGEQVWRFWEDPVKFLCQDVWEEFWDWISVEAAVSEDPDFSQFNLSLDILYVVEDLRSRTFWMRLTYNEKCRYLRSIKYKDKMNHQWMEENRKGREERELARINSVRTVDASFDVLI